MEAAAHEISELARELADETERQRHLADALLARLRKSGLMNAGAPREVGGLELPPGELLAQAEEIARGDASAGWCVSIAATSSLLAGYLPEPGRAELFADPEGIASGIFAPRGTARPVQGGVVVDGRWPYCSGITHAGVLFAGCLLQSPEGEGDGRMLPIAVALAREQLEVLDTWHTLGLRGTGSHDAVANGVFVAAERSFSLFDGPRVGPPPLPVPRLRVLRRVDLGGRAGQRARCDRRVRRAGCGQGRPGLDAQARRALGDPGRRRRGGGVAAGGARALYYQAIGAAWDAAQSSEPVAVPLRNELRMASTHAVRVSADVVRALYDLAGGPAIYDDSPLQRRFRDAFTATAHFQVNQASRELQGRLLLGLPADSLMI